MNKPSLLIIGPTPPPFHGVAEATRILLESHIGDSFDLHHLDTSDRRRLDSINQPDLWDIWLFICQWFKLLTRMLGQKDDLVYLSLSQTSMGFLRDSFFLWLFFFRGCRVVLHLHGGNFRTWFRGRSMAMQWYVRLILARIDRMVVLGTALRPMFDGLLPSHKIVVVPNGIALNEMEAVGQSKPLFDSRSQRFHLLYLGTLHKRKGVLRLLKAIPLVLQKYSDVKFIFAGPWSNTADRAEAEEFISHNALLEHTVFLGQVEGRQKWQILQEADLFVFPGLQQEGQPLVVLEAMAAGLAVLTTDRGCLGETVVDGQTGLVIPEPDHEVLAEKILWLMKRPDLLKAMGEKGRHRALHQYTSLHFCLNMEKVFLQVLALSAAKCSQVPGHHESFP